MLLKEAKFKQNKLKLLLIENYWNLRSPNRHYVTHKKKTIILDGIYDVFAMKAGLILNTKIKLNVNKLTNSFLGFNSEI